MIHYIFGLNVHNKSEGHNKPIDPTGNNAVLFFGGSFVARRLMAVVLSLKTNSMTPLDEIRSRLKKYPDLQVRDDGERIEVFPATESGFPVSFYHHGAEYTVGYAGWHDTFDDPTKALNCFAFGLSEDCRLKVTHRGRFEYRWVVEHFNDGIWQQVDEVGLLVPVPFWRKKEIKYLRNNVIKATEQTDQAEVLPEAKPGLS